MNFTEVNLTKVGTTITDEDIEKIEELIRTDELFELKLLGQGCFGRVYKYDSLNGKSYAIKYGKKVCYDADISTSHDIDTLLLLRGNKYILDIHAYDNTNMEDYFIMVVDFVDGVKLNDFGSQFDLDDKFIDVFQKTLENLISNHISANDLHGHNIMIDRNSGIPIIVDYGGLYQDEDEKFTLNSYNYRTALQRVRETYNSYIYNKSFRVA